MGEWLEPNKGYTVMLNADGSGTSTLHQGGKACNFTWHTWQETLIVEGLSGNHLPWPPKDDAYEMKYETGSAPGSATLYLSKSTPSGSTPPPAGTPDSWGFERR